MAVASIFSRPIDLIFAVTFAFFCFIATFVDPTPCFTGGGAVTLEKLATAPWPPAFFREAWWWWGTNFDPLLVANPKWMEVANLLSPLYVPFYLFAIRSLITGNERLKQPGLIWSAMMTVVLILILAESLFGAPEARTPNPTVFLAAYGGYLLVPIFFAIRIWPARLFKDAAAGKKDA